MVKEFQYGVVRHAPVVLIDGQTLEQADSTILWTSRETG